MRATLALALALALPLQACQRQAPPVRHDPATARHDTPPGEPSADVTAPPPDAPAPGASRLLALADRIATDLATIRGLPIRRPIARGVMNRASIVSRLRERVGEEYPAGEIELEGELLKRLGMLPETMDYERTMFELLEEQVAGFYDPHERTLYIAEWVPTEAQPATLAHEITHALQDQHFDIARFTHHLRGRGDAQSAAMAVVEGDATVSMTDHMLAPMHRTVRDLPDPERMFRSQVLGATDPRLASAPRALRETLLFPYLAGFALCARLEREGGHAPVDALLREPPASTEQVLHPDKLTSREPPVELPPSVPTPLASDHALAYHDVLGEFQSRLFFYGALPDAEAEAAAQGWGGDHAVLLAPTNTITAEGDGGVRVSPDGLSRDVLLWTVALDPGPRGHDDAEAVEFANAAVRVLAHRYTDARTVTVPGALSARTVADGRVSLVARAGRTVLVADRVPADRAAQVVRAALAPSRAPARR